MAMSANLVFQFIALHTFSAVWMRKHHRVRTAVIIVAISWTFMALFVGIAAGKHRNYDEPSPVSSSSSFSGQRSP